MMKNSFLQVSLKTTKNLFVTNLGGGWYSKGKIIIVINSPSSTRRVSLKKTLTNSLVDVGLKVSYS